MMKVSIWSGLATVVAGTVVGGVLTMAPSGAATAGERGTPECTASDLTAKYAGGDAGMSHVWGRIVLRNVSGSNCWIKGYGGLSYVGGGNGTQVGAPADRTSSPTPKTVLEPGDKVSSQVQETSTGPYSPSLCKPTPVDGFRVYVPDETKSIYVAHPTTGCANAKVHLLTHKAYR